MIINGNDALLQVAFLPNMAIGDAAGIRTHWWTFLVYGWFQLPGTPFELLSNMVWLYCFASVVQGLVGYKQIIPLFAYALFLGGLAYMATRLALPAVHAPVFLLGSRAGLIAMAVAAVTLAPQYRFYFTETFSIPLMLVAAVFVFLQLISTSLLLPTVILCVAGGLTGFGYVHLLKSGYRPGEWWYSLLEKVNNSVTPAEQRSYSSRAPKRRTIPLTGRKPAELNLETRIDEILDKINQKGYNSLTREEKDLLLRAGRQ